MEISINGISVNVLCESNLIPKEKTPIIFLHGFAGFSEDWIFIFDKLDSQFFPIAIDLPGHGKSIFPNNLENFSTNSYVETINIVLDYFQIEKAIFVGYSMGGRTALSFAIANPNKTVALILESATAGIENNAERKSRIATDVDIADNILSDGINSFVDYWLNLPFFRSLKSLDKIDYKKLIEQKRENSPIGLSNSLKGFSTGIMPSLWNKLKLLSTPTLLITGSLDRKYVRLNKKMNVLIPNSELKIIDNCGHNTHLENKEEFTIFVNTFLNTLK